jgi:Cu-Zn family superoxide dismutase|tara:strand:- start:1307 stop:2035 length:729 start_codon:yes stop_codon:yes gene_type:complete
MKKNIILVLSLFLATIMGCQNLKKESKLKKTIEVNVDRTDSITKAEVRITADINGEFSEEVQIFEGTHEEVMEKVELVTKNSGDSDQTVRKTIKKNQFILSPKSGSNTNGTVIFTEKDGQVTLELVMNRLSQGTHAIHIHEKADCSSEDGKSSGGHWNPTFENHGAWGSKDGYHKGDIGNFLADKNGNGGITFSTDQWCLGCDDDTKNLIGKAVIVHQGTDDLISQPSGAAGARISCVGIIE